MFCIGGDAEGDDVMADTVATETASAVAAVVGLLNSPIFCLAYSILRPFTLFELGRMYP
jgi:hypothetical protein